MAMHKTPGCAFSPPPCAAIRVYGDQRAQPLATLARPHSIDAQQVLQATDQRDWETLAYRPGRRLAERRSGRRGAQQLLQLSVGGNDPEEGREKEAPAGQPRQQPQRVGERVLLPASAAAPSSTTTGEDEDVVILDDPFEELEGDRRRYPCVLHNTLAAGPTPYNDGWEWQKQVRGGSKHWQ